MTPPGWGGVAWRRHRTMRIEPVFAREGAGRSIAPTDVAQFIRLEQCRRFLRLRLYEKSRGLGFMYDFGVRPQSIPPILTASGQDFERRIEADVARDHFKINFVGDVAHGGSR